MAQHCKFILTPISQLLDEAISSLSCIEVGLSTYPIADYFLKSLFLKMTGFQEQKLKCICWDMATVDYEYRYERYAHGFSARECSSYSDKCIVLHDIFNEIKKQNHNINLGNCINISTVISRVQRILDGFYTDANLRGWLERDYNDYKKHFSILQSCFSFNENGNIFKNKDSCPKNCRDAHSVCKEMRWNELYQCAVYNFRNQCAHNTCSYQREAIPLRQIYIGGDLCQNYFVRFHFLLLIDIIFVEYYMVLLKCY